MLLTHNNAYLGWGISKNILTKIIMGWESLIFIQG
jgi:hypothetical protein